MINVGINGFGRIGRAIFRLAQERKDIKIVAINDLLDIKYIAYILKYDSTHGRTNSKIEVKNNNLVVNKRNIVYLSNKDPEYINWEQLNVDIVIEATGKFLTKEKLMKHIKSGAKKVVLTAPPKCNDIPMFIMGVNNEKYNNQNIISNASCTTNCLAPLLKVINYNFGIKEAMLTTVHSSTVSQKIIDDPVNSTCWRGGRGALQNIIPYPTKATKALGKVMPELKNKIIGISFRVPTANVSVSDITVSLDKSTNISEIFNVIKYSSKNKLKGILSYTTSELVSSDFNGSKFASIFDVKASIMLNSNFFKIISWYDNEIGYSNMLLNLVEYIY